MCYLLKSKRKGYTLPEVLIAAAIFSIFLIAVFSLFNMGSRMYISGSWKYNKQKEGERFLEILKERIEQASIPSKIKKDGEKIIIEKAGNVGFFINKNEEIQVKNLSGKRYISEFVVSKVDKTQTPTASAGLILNHCLYCEPQDNGLAKLCLYVNDKSSDPNNKSVSFSGFKFPPDDFGGNFNAKPSNFSFPQIPHSYALSDIQSITINNGFYATGTANINQNSITRNPIISLKIKMECPKHPETTLELKMQARIDPSVRFAVVEF